MIYTIKYEEIVRRINSVTIGVENENDGKEIADKLYDRVKEFDHPDCIFEELHDMGIKIIETCKGAETCEYEIQ